MSRCYLGVDAGNSKTVALLADADGRVLGRGRAGVGDIYGVPDAEDAVDAVLDAAGQALAAAGVAVDGVAHAAFRLAGVDWDEDEAFWTAALARREPALRPASVRNDGYALLRCGQPSGVGVAVTAGSGPAVSGRGPDGREWSAGWWIQHELAGRGLGMAGVRAVVDAATGLGPATGLTPLLLELFDEPDVPALLHSLTRREGRRPDRDTWRAARSVLRAAGDGDAVAAGVVDRHAAVLAGLVAVTARETGLDTAPGPVPVVLGGSVLTSEHPAYRTAVTAALADAVGPVAVTVSTAPPVVGALLDALAEGGVALAPDLHARVLGTPHPADFLLT
ncbi:BadF/BadG/BcrA/BcrD ATPase family protein [Microlunatus capsulatus]|uniref:N-acetylglucosamine kinase-like BadF-type ATPase n=1 Tax=Microlunatus capsulatus TaxID=99117 RepID=A0ABS4Z747_9ACTN|nr:BadF/BadG/BcrA/BcrD ATPase family protein [Microlunatus capsulatus]MBP2416789.1 N-acetylglucosamine kinase-like BadF-type ATPase [Microlunatus capsulatus]